MDPYLTEEAFGNPSSAHAFGRRARQAVDDARQRIAAALGANPAGVVFTSGGTEADNLAVLGSALRARGAGKACHVAVGATEHKAVLDAARAVGQFGGETVILPVDADGQVDAAAAEAALQREIAVLSVMWVNNETGVVQDPHRLASLASERETPFHTDAVQAVGKIPCSMANEGITLLTISGHKIGAPKGIGALLVRNRTAVAPLVHGGGQQWNVRPGTENVAGAVALAVAVELAVTEHGPADATTRALRDTLETRVLAAIPDAVVIGRAAPRAPHICSVAFRGTDAGLVLALLDQAGIACSAGSACNTGAPTPSHVLTAMGVEASLAGAAARFSFGRTSTAADVDRVLEILPGVVARARTAGGALGRA